MISKRKPLFKAWISTFAILFGFIASQNLLFAQATVAPSIVTQPQNQTVIVGANVVINVAATGTAPLVYQWRKNGSTLLNGGNISGAMTANLTLSNVTQSDAAGYSVIVINASGSATSSSATLSVNVAPTATLTVQTNILGATPNLLAYNSGHFITNSNTRDWWRYAGVKGARIFISPTTIEATDDISPVGDGVTNQTSFVSRKAALRADPFNPAYINWSYFSNRYDTVDLGSSGGTANRIRVNYAARELRKLGIQICAQLTVTQARFLIADPNDWANKWELWQHFYVEAFYLGRTFDVERYQMFNEPDHSSANGLTQADFLQRLQLCSDAMQSALADVNALYGKSLVPKFLAPVITTPSYNSWSAAAVTNRHLNYLGQTDSNFLLFQQYDYHQYNVTPSGFGSNLASLRTSISNAMAPETPFPVSISEFNVNTAGTFDTIPDTLDYPSKYPAFGSIAVNLMQNGAEELYNFKFSQTTGEAGDAYPNRKNGMHYVDNDNSPYNTGGITKAGEVWRLFNTAFAPGRNRLNTVKSSGASGLDVQTSYDPVAKRYYIFSANNTASDIGLNLNLSALNLSDSTKVLLEEVSENFHGAGKFWTTVSAAQSTLGTQGSNTVWLITISSETQSPEQILAATEDADVRDGVNKAINYGANGTLTARNDTNSTANRSVAFIKFLLPTNNFSELQYAVVSLQASSATVSTTAQAHVYAITNNTWTQNALTWNNAPNLKSNVTNGVTISKQFVSGQGTDVSIVGQLVVSSTTPSEKLIDVTSYLRAQSNSTISFLISQDPRWDVTLPSLVAGDTQPDGVKILSKESGSGPILRLVFKSTAVNTAPVATNDNYIATEDTPLTVSAPGVLDNDFDAETNLLSAILLSNPSNGVVTLNSNGSFTYTPTPNFFGADSFTYQASDGQTNSGVATVFITVNSVNDNPIAANDSATTAADTSVVIDILANDSDIDGGALSILSYTQGASGSVVNNGNGTLSYTPNSGFFGGDNFNYTISDGLGGTSSATVSVTVSPPPGTPYPKTLPATIEAFVRGGASATSNQDEVATGYILIKYNASPFDASRKAYFQFDLTGLGANLNTQAVFTVTTHTNNFAQRAQLWALNQSYTNFSDTITWSAAQANDTNSNGLLSNGAFTATPIGASAFFSSATSTTYTFTIPRLGDYALSNRLTLVLTGVDDAANSAGGLRLARTNASLQFIAGLASPSIVTEPTSRTNAAGSEATFSVAATGTAPLIYQWKKGNLDLTDGGNISGTTSGTLTLVNVSSSDATNYSVIVSNSAGTAASASAILTVIIPPAITAQPSSQTNSAGTTATFSATATGTAPLSFQWKKGAANLSDGGNISGVATGTLTLTSVTQSDAGNYSVLITNAAGTVTSSPAELVIINPPVITAQPVGRTNNASTTALFSVAATGGAPLNYQWKKDGVNLVDAGNISGAFSANLTVASVLAADAANYNVVITNSAGAVSSANAILVVNDPVITAQPLHRTNISGTTATFSVTADGTAPLNFQWRKGVTDLVDGGNISGSSSGTLTLGNVSQSEATNYSVVVSNAVGVVTSSAATLTVNFPPVITTQPQGQSVNAGGSMTLSVTATGSSPLSYQWRLNNSTISGATLSSYSKSNLQLIDAGNYSVQVTNVAGLVLSSNAILTVVGSSDSILPSVSIGRPGNNVHFLVGETNFSGTAKDTAPGTVVGVKYRLDPATEFTSAVLTTESGVTNWTTGNHALVAGTNRLAVYGVDSGGNFSAIETNLFFYDLTDDLTVKLAGNGEVKTATGPVTDNQMIALLVGRPFALTAWVGPGTNYVFTNWTDGSSAQVSTNLVYNFVMQTNLVLQANFITNPFTPVQGIYNGLFYETSGITHRSAGFFTLKLSEKAGYSGKLYLDGDAVSISGKFDLSGRTTKSVSRATTGKVSLNLFMELDWGTMSEQIHGTLGDGNWTAEMLGDRATFSATNPATSYVGNYTFLVPRTNDAVNAPGGMGYGLVTNNLLGTITLSGGLGDGSVLAQKVSVSKNGQWPLYAQLYKSTNNVTNLVTGVVTVNKANYRGSLLGWLTFTNQMPVGGLSWIKGGDAATNYLYPNGFTNGLGVMGSPYVPPVSGSGTRMLEITNGTITFSEGNMSGPAAWSVSWASNNVISCGAISKPTFSLTTKSGLLKGAFPHPQLGTTNYYGAVLQNQNYSAGYFKGTNQSGLMRLERQ